MVSLSLKDLAGLPALAAAVGIGVSAWMVARKFCCLHRKETNLSAAPNKSGPIRPVVETSTTKKSAPRAAKATYTVEQVDTATYNGAHVEAGMTMSQADADRHLLENAAKYAGHVQLDAYPGQVFFARIGASLFHEGMKVGKCAGCTARILVPDGATAPKVGYASEPALVSSRTAYEAPGTAAFVPKFTLFATDPKSGAPATAATECVEGGVGSCWLVAALAAVADYPQYIPRLFKARDDGGYDVSLFIMSSETTGDWRTFTIDTSLPACAAGSGFEAAYTKPSADAVPTLWAALLEKAYAASGGDSCAAERSSDAF